MLAVTWLPLYNLLRDCRGILCVEHAGGAGAAELPEAHIRVGDLQLGGHVPLVARQRRHWGLQ